MKTKQLSKKLSLSKITVATLNDCQMNVFLGGAVTQPVTRCTPDTVAEDCTMVYTICQNISCVGEC